MTQFNKEIMAALAQKQDLDEVFRQHLETAINDLMHEELSSFLGYEPYDRQGFNSGNSRNGHYLRTFKTKYGELNLEVPRDRNGAFNTQTIPSYQRQTDGLEATVVQLYEKGITTSEIADLIEKMYGAHYTPQTVSNLTKVVDQQVNAFKTRPLASRYAVIYVDATYLPLRRDSVAKEAVHIAIGIRPNGMKEVLAYQVAPTESSTVWEELLVDIQQRGVKEVLLFVADGLVGLTNTIGDHFPKAKLQQCLIHVSRNIEAHVRTKDRQEVLNDFKLIHQAATMDDAKQALADFIDKWQKAYPKVTGKLENNPHLLTCFTFPAAIRSSIYSTNLIESFNKKLKRQTKKKEQFPNEPALERVLVTVIRDYNGQNFERTHRGFKKIQDTLESMY